MTIRAKLALGLFSIAAILLLPLLLALRSLERLHDTTTELRNREFAASLLLGRMRSGADALRQRETALLFVHDSASYEAMTAQIDSIWMMSRTLRAYDLDLAASDIRSAVADAGRYTPLEFRAAAAGRTKVADSISTHHLVPAINRMDSVLTVAADALRERTAARVESASEETANAQQVSAVALLLAAATALLIAVVVWRSISRPVSDLESGMAAVASGNFAHHLSVSSARRDEFGRLAGSFRTMADQLAQLDRLKAEFISVASHELKTPINVVLGYLQLIEEGSYGQISPRLREILRTVDAQTRSLSRLVHQLLDVSRFEAGGGKLDLRPTNLDRFLCDLEDTFRVLSMQRGIDFRIERFGTLPQEVVWDPDRMNEVLGNLLSNAFKFTERGGTIELTVEALADAIQIMVRDTGAGIAPAQLPHIFKKFYQADNQEAADQHGTGLGLAIAKQIVTAHGGRIEVDSTVGLGTTFWITLPIRAGRRVAAPRRPARIGEPV